MGYADYDFYRNVYVGQSISAQDFPPLMERATDYVRGMTGGRSDRVREEDREAVQKAACAVAEALSEEESMRAGAFSGQQAVASESVGGWSRTYRAASLSSAETEYLEGRKRQALLLYLSGIPALAALFQVRSYSCGHTVR